MLFRYRNQKYFNYRKENSLRYDSMRHIRTKKCQKVSQSLAGSTFHTWPTVNSCRCTPRCSSTMPCSHPTWMADPAFLLQEGRETQGTKCNERVMREGDVASFWQCPLMAHPTPSHPPQIWCCQHPPNPQKSASVMTSSSDTDGNIQTDYRLVGFEAEHAIFLSIIQLEFNGGKKLGLIQKLLPRHLHNWQLVLLTDSNWLNQSNHPGKHW